MRTIAKVGLIKTIFDMIFPMEADRLKWNEKHATRPYPDTPAPLLERYISEAPMVGKALDIACGTGRNAIYMAKHGFAVDAVDLSDYAIEKLLAVDNLHAIHADLDHYRPEADRYSLIINIHFLSRRLFPLIKEALVPGGLLLFQSFIKHPDYVLESFTNDEHYLRPNELLQAFSDLYVIHYEENIVERQDRNKAFLGSLAAIKRSVIP